MMMVPLQCPKCKAHGWVTRVAATLLPTTFGWRCTNCQYEWLPVQRTPDTFTPPRES